MGKWILWVLLVLVPGVCLGAPADKTINDLTAETSVASDDYVPIWDTSESKTRKAAVGSITGLANTQVTSWVQSQVSAYPYASQVTSWIAAGTSTFGTGSGDLTAVGAPGTTTGSSLWAGATAYIVDASGIGSVTAWIAAGTSTFGTGAGGGSGSGLTTIQTSDGTDAVADVLGGADGGMFVVGRQGIATTATGNSVFILADGVHTQVSSYVQSQVSRYVPSSYLGYGDVAGVSIAPAVFGAGAISGATIADSSIPESKMSGTTTSMGVETEREILGKVRVLSIGSGTTITGVSRFGAWVAGTSVEARDYTAGVSVYLLSAVGGESLVISNRDHTAVSGNTVYVVFTSVDRVITPLAGSTGFAAGLSKFEVSGTTGAQVITLIGVGVSTWEVLPKATLTVVKR